MPGNRVKTMKALQSRKGSVNGKVIHPNSRRAKQLQRIELRSKKLEIQSKVRRNDEVGRMDRQIYFVHALPDDRTSVSLAELHQILDDYISRDDQEMADLEKERKERSWRKGEGKSKREVELEKRKEGEMSEYRSGFILPDLTLAENVFLCRQWVDPGPSIKNPNVPKKGGDPSFLGRIRLVRIFEGDKNLVKVYKEGAREGEWEKGAGEVEMELQEGEETPENAQDEQ